MIRDHLNWQSESINKAVKLQFLRWRTVRCSLTNLHKPRGRKLKAGSNRAALRSPSRQTAKTRPFCQYTVLLRTDCRRRLADLQVVWQSRSYSTSVGQPGPADEIEKV